MLDFLVYYCSVPWAPSSLLSWSHRSKGWLFSHSPCRAGGWVSPSTHIYGPGKKGWLNLQEEVCVLHFFHRPYGCVWSCQGNPTDMFYCLPSYKVSNSSFFPSPTRIFTTLPLYIYLLLCHSILSAPPVMPPLTTHFFLLFLQLPSQQLLYCSLPIEGLLWNGLSFLYPHLPSPSNIFSRPTSIVLHKKNPGKPLMARYRGSWRWFTFIYLFKQTPFSLTFLCSLFS